MTKLGLSHLSHTLPESARLACSRLEALAAPNSHGSVERIGACACVVRAAPVVLRGTDVRESLSHIKGPSLRLGGGIATHNQSSSFVSAPLGCVRFASASYAISNSSPSTSPLPFKSKSNMWRFACAQ
eukprot:782956-Prymnesium_polylepis.1